MAAIRNETVLAAIIRASALTDPNIHNDITKLYEFRKQTLLDDESLTADERTEAIKKLTINYDHNKLLFNEGTKRRCENCSLECLATSYCEHCKNLQNIEYMTKGGCNKIYSANWISEEYVKWNSKERQLTFKVVLKELGNIEAANRSWFDEAKSHLILSNKYTDFVGCCGLTQDSSKTLYYKIQKMWHDIQNGKFNTSEYNDSSQIQSNSNSNLYLLSMSKFYQFENLPEPKNATEGEQEEFPSKPYDFEIPNNI
ncbi:kinase-like domain-containing protein [Rhizophagus irregularis DAOM 181602=DAOM 197198]|nr:kinase-like domain-containing protein [Rhizophagus irregularis DAOM 181602=DAOM 197198]